MSILGHDAVKGAGKRGAGRPRPLKIKTTGSCGVTVDFIFCGFCFGIWLVLPKGFLKDST
ncbi:MAG TPA: hypothetical protein VG938_18075 [Verrucomicrobiae bacterium]|nr:hypothetical protein [Verrucomicrobiae bacterium]